MISIHDWPYQRIPADARFGFLSIVAHGNCIVRHLGAVDNGFDEDDFDSRHENRMRIHWDQSVPMDDGTVLRCDVFRPEANKGYPVIMSYGPYGKLLHFEDGFPRPWALVSENNPALRDGSSNRYQNFEVVDPEKFVPEGFAVVRFDSRGSGRSPGYLDPWSAREARDIYHAVEWCAEQAWCSGRVGISGTSYLAMNQWQVAALQPPHLRALCIWEGASDIYRDMVRHGGILSTFGKVWYESGVIPVQHGRGIRGHRSRMNGDWVSGPESLSDEELEANRVNWFERSRSEVLATADFWQSRQADLSKIRVPLLVTANWGGQGLHLRGSMEGFNGAASREKWLDVHCGNHWREYYTEYGFGLQKRFFEHFLKGEANGWPERRPVHYWVRRPDSPFSSRFDNEWPLVRTCWEKLYLDAETQSLQPERPSSGASAAYRGFSDGVTFLSAPMKAETEITGPLAAKIFISTESEDADLFLVVRVFRPDMSEVTFPGHIDPNTPVAQGWLRASHLKLDPDKSLPYRPYHTHDSIEPLEAGQVYELDIEILPTCIVVPAGFRIGLSVRGRDYLDPGARMAGIQSNRAFTGVGQFRHNDGIDRPPNIFDRHVNIHTGGDHGSYLVVPRILPET